MAVKLSNPNVEQAKGETLDEVCQAMDEREKCVRSCDGEASVKMTHDWGCWHHAWANYSAP